MSIFKWTSPIRQRGLSPIPNEVYMEIFNYLRPSEDKPWIDLVHRRDFSRVALVCRFFCSVMLPWMFESIELEDMKQSGSSLNHAPFCRSIINGCGSAQIIATYIKRCSFSGWIQDPDDLSPSWSKMEFQMLYSTALALMPNVEELCLSSVCITKHLLRSMIKLKCLTSLSLDKCLFSKAKNKDILKLSVLRLKSLHFFTASQICHDDSLFISSVCFDSLLTLHTNCVSFVTRIAKEDCYLPLQELDLAIVLDVGLLPKAVQKIPALKKLRIFDVATSQHEIQFDNVLPVLEELCCPSSLLRSLVPGRPISSIKFTTIEPSMEIIDTIQSLFKPSTGRIHSLSVPANVYQRVWKHFPDLETLRLEFTQDYRWHLSPKHFFKEYISDISHTLSRNLPIQELHLDFLFSWLNLRFDLELQHGVISTIIEPRFPQLRRATISDCVVWNKVQEDDVWKPSLQAPLLSVAKQLRSGEVNPVDYDGFFERILSTAEEFW